MKLTQVADDGTLLHLRCEGTITQEGLIAHNDLLAEVIGPAYATRRVLLDLERCEFIDSSGVGWLVVYHKRFAVAGGKLILHSVPPRVLHVLQILRMHLIFNIAPNIVTARGVALAEMAT